MKSRWRNPGFSLIELLVVLAVTGLLLAIAIPSMRGAREQTRRTTCLANLSILGRASLSYASEDRKELVIPIHEMMRTRIPVEDYWLRRTAMWFSVGGRTPTIPFLTDQGPRLLNDATPWAAKTRPLNRMILRTSGPSAGDPLQVFHCPSDTGYPDNPRIDDAPHENAERACFDSLGNSYRANLFAIYPRAAEPYEGAFSPGPWGHKLSTIPMPAQVPILGEPLFFNMIGMDSGIISPDPVLTVGWHGQQSIENLLFADGSARPTRAAGYESVDDSGVRARMAVGSNWDLITRGPGWRFDVWPTPGARIWAYDKGNLLWNPPYSAHPAKRSQSWPFLMAQDILQN